MPHHRAHQPHLADMEAAAAAVGMVGTLTAFIKHFQLYRIPFTQLRLETAAQAVRAAQAAQVTRKRVAVVQVGAAVTAGKDSSESFTMIHKWDNKN